MKFISWGQSLTRRADLPPWSDRPLHMTGSSKLPPIINVSIFIILYQSKTGNNVDWGLPQHLFSLTARTSLDIMHMTSQRECALHWRKAHIIATLTNKCRQLTCVWVGSMPVGLLWASVKCMSCLQCSLLFASKWSCMMSMHKVYITFGQSSALLGSPGQSSALLGSLQPLFTSLHVAAKKKKPDWSLNKHQFHNNLIKTYRVIQKVMNCIKVTKFECGISNLWVVKLYAVSLGYLAPRNHH